MHAAKAKENAKYRDEYPALGEPSQLVELLPSPIGHTDAPIGGLDERQTADGASAALGGGESCRDLVRRLEASVLEIEKLTQTQTLTLTLTLALILARSLALTLTRISRHLRAGRRRGRRQPPRYCYLVVPGLLLGVPVLLLVVPELLRSSAVPERASGPCQRLFTHDAPTPTPNHEEGSDASSYPIPYPQPQPQP